MLAEFLRGKCLLPRLFQILFVERRLAVVHKLRPSPAGAIARDAVVRVLVLCLEMPLLQELAAKNLSTIKTSPKMRKVDVP